MQGVANTFSSLDFYLNLPRHPRGEIPFIVHFDVGHLVAEIHATPAPIIKKRRPITLIILPF
jgi:hypothetical protein